MRGEGKGPGLSTRWFCEWKRTMIGLVRLGELVARGRWKPVSCDDPALGSDVVLWVSFCSSVEQNTDGGSGCDHL